MVPMLRNATLADVDALLTFWLTAAQDAGRYDLREAVAALVTHDPDALLLAVEADDADEQVVGSVVAGWDGWRCHLYRLTVHPERRRAAIAQALLFHAEKRFRHLGGARIEVIVLTDDEFGESLWRATGYQHDENCRRWVKRLRPTFDEEVQHWAEVFAEHGASLVGLDEPTARARSEALGMHVRVIDERSPMMTLDFSPSRVNLFMSHGVVLRVDAG